MKALILSLSLAQPIPGDPKICDPAPVATNQAMTCCTENTGRQCCSRATDQRTGKPLGCNC